MGYREAQEIWKAQGNEVMKETLDSKARSEVFEGNYWDLDQKELIPGVLAFDHECSSLRITLEFPRFPNHN